MKCTTYSCFTCFVVLGVDMAVIFSHAKPSSIITSSSTTMTTFLLDRYENSLYIDITGKEIISDKDDIGYLSDDDNVEMSTASCDFFSSELLSLVNRKNARFGEVSLFLSNFLYQQQEKQSPMTTDARNQEVFFREWCMKHAAVIPHIPLLSDQTKGEEQEHLFLIFKNSPSSDRRNNGKLDADNNHSMSHSHRYLQHFFHYDGKKITHSTDETNIFSPLFQHDEKKPKESSLFSLSSTSKFTEAGMHPQAQYTFYFTPRYPAVNKKKSHDKTFTLFNRGIIRILIPLSEELFIDLDDPFPSSTNQCEFTNTHVHSNISSSIDIRKPSKEKEYYSCQMNILHSRVIDIEQPSFVSPQNAIIIEVNIDDATMADVTTSTLTDKNDKDSSFELSFNLSLHFRYQLPNNKRKVSVSMPPRPIIHSGKFDFMSAIRYGNNNNKHYTSFLLEPSLEYEPIEQSMMTTNICTGSMNDFWFVFLVTLFVSFYSTFLTAKYLILEEYDNKKSIK